MKIQYKNQEDQNDAVRAVADVFEGQPNMQNSYLMDVGTRKFGDNLTFDDFDVTAWSNKKLVAELDDNKILNNIRCIQQENGLEPSKCIERRQGTTGYNLTIEMETGVGKTFTYIKTIFELNKRYGWSKFIIVVPSIAIREGVYKQFQMTEDFFKNEYQKTARYFIYNSKRLNEIDQFAKDNTINVMIINSQAFNSDDANINKKLDTFRSRRPIDVISKTNPILIIDEPQSVEGKETVEKLKRFNPLFTIRYSATHRKDSLFNMVYRLDAVDAFKKKLVKKISVFGIEESASNATNSYIYLKSINISSSYPSATIEIDYKGKTTTRKKLITVKEGANLYNLSNELQEYKKNWIVNKIDARNNGYISFLNGKELKVGEVIGKNTDEHIRRIQIRETIQTHINKEKSLFKKDIKVLSLFFIDHVENYRKYVKDNTLKGNYAEIFEEEYNEYIKEFIKSFKTDCKKLEIKEKEHEDYKYIEYLNTIGNAENTHTGYFSKDKKGHMIDSHVKRGEASSDDVDAYTLIMKDKERLIDLNPKNSPWRFIFSHSALKEGWDNTNVFQICTLKEGQSETRRRQEIGRGLRICVDNNGERQDYDTLKEDFFYINDLTVIASESYNDFVSHLQTEIREAVSDRAIEINEDLFIGKIVHDKNGKEIKIDKKLATQINHSLIFSHYIDDDNLLSQVYYEEKENNELHFDEKIDEYRDDIIRILDSVYNINSLPISNARKDVELHVDKKKLESKEFKNLWNKINAKSIFKVYFDYNELVEKAVKAINDELKITALYYKMVKGEQREDMTINDLDNKTAFKTTCNDTEDIKLMKVSSSIKYDLIGKIAEQTTLTRKDVADILTKIDKKKFDLFKNNPEEFILKISKLINDAKSSTVVEHIEYIKLNEKYETNIFTDSTIKGQYNKNCIKVDKHLYDNLVYDSTHELNFANDIDKNKNVKLYVKLPGAFYINTPVGAYNPDWAIAYEENGKKHIYFVAETKGNMESLDINLRGVEKIKTECAKKHFKAICNENLTYGVVDSMDGLLDILKVK